MGLVSSAACCAAEGACCAGISCLSCCCRSGSSKGAPSSKLAKIFYLFMVIISTILALVLRAYGDQMFFSLYSFKFGCTDGESSRCFGDQAVYRVSFGLAAFFLFMLAGSASRSFHRGYWGLKMALFALLIVGSFFIPNTFFNVYSEVSRVVSVVFLLLMIIILVDFAHSIQEMYSEYVAAQDEEGIEPGCCSSKADILYLIVAGGMILGGFIAICFMYSFATHHNCSGQVGLLSVTLLCGVAIIVMSVLDVFGAPGLLCPAVVFVYAVWLQWSAMTSEDTTECNPYGSQDDQPWYVVAIGVVITGLSLAYTSYSAANAVPDLCGGSDDSEDLTSPLVAPRTDVEAGKKNDDSDADDADSGDDRPRSLAVESPEAADTGRSDQPWKYHLIMFSASLYMAMLLTNWGVGTSSGTSTTGTTSMWIKIITMWLTYLLYLWTLLAPVCMPNRDFS
mmetsp:Transcript_11194/g.23296  ORF Transcript_11194/g.23296 Transcript_11194/m.23296 type:complete len:451 (-) Transcript_11194:75-1427(-)